MVQLQLNFKNKIKNKTIEKSYTEGLKLKMNFTCTLQTGYLDYKKCLLKKTAISVSSEKSQVLLILPLGERKKTLNYIKIGKSNTSPNYQANVISCDAY